MRNFIDSALNLFLNRDGDLNPYIQVDLQSIHIVTSIETQGRAVPSMYQWIKTYQIEHSADKVQWTYVLESGSAKVSLAIHSII